MRLLFRSMLIVFALALCPLAPKPRTVSGLVVVGVVVTHSAARVPVSLAGR